MQWEKITSNQNYTLSSDALRLVILVGGGGGGGKITGISNGSGGGGAGGVVIRFATFAAATYSLVIGAGGGSNANGSDTTGFGFAAPGGGKGAGFESDFIAVGNGGSGGGALGSGSPVAGGTAVYYLGNAGGVRRAEKRIAQARVAVDLPASAETRPATTQAMAEQD